MASLGHIAVGMAAGRALTPRGQNPTRAMLALSALSMWPDVDVIGFRFGVDYGDPFGHRGATHSSVVALAIGLSIYLALRWRRSKTPEKTALVATLVALSHGWLDTMTHGGGLGVALLWPFSNHRFWAPFRPIPIAPIGLELFTQHGIAVMIAESILFTPFWIYALWPRRPRPA